MNTKGMFSKLAFAYLCSAIFSAALWAQATSQIQGTVLDSTGATVPGAAVRATQTATGALRTATSGADGTYILSNLPLGPYSLEVTKEGFSRYVRTGIVLQVGVSPTVDVSMQVGAVTDQVNVEANATLVETQATGIGSVIETQRILELPLNGRNATDLIAIAGGAVQSGVGSSRSMQGGQAISVAGGQTFGIAYFLDGTTHNNQYDNLNLPFPFPDALQEFKVETGATTAVNGGHAGAVVNAVVRSGSNAFHGSAFEFLRNYNANARDPFAAARDTLKRNQFGGTIGGPILKNKLFFFAGYQGTRTRQDPSDQFTYVPTADMLAGDFRTFAGPSCNGGKTINLTTERITGTGNNLFNGNVISPAFFSPAAKNIAAQLPSTGDPCGLINFGPRTLINEYQTLGRVDYQINDKQMFFSRYMATTFFQPTPNSFEGSNLLSTITGGRDNLAQSWTVGHTYLVSPTVVNSLRAAFNRTAVRRTSIEFFSLPDVGVNSYSYMPGYTILRVNNGFGLGGGTENNATFRTTTYQISDDVNIVRGAHQIAFGITASQWRSKSLANVRSPGSVNFSGTVTGLGLADFLYGYLAPSGATPGWLQSAPNTLDNRQNYVALYAQDTWKVGTRLTLNFGLRWEPWLPQTIANGAIYSFNFGRFDQGVKSDVFINAPAGFLFPGDKEFVGSSGTNRRWLNMAPRVGLAWDPSGDGKTSIRASFGVSYDYVNGQFYINASNAPPWGSEVRIPGPVPFDDPFVGDTNIFPVTFNATAPFSPFGTFLSVQPDQRTERVYSWNFSLQRQLTPAWFVSANYIGSQTVHLWTTTQGNPGQIVGPITNVGCTATSTDRTCAANLNLRRTLYLQNPAEAQYIGAVDRIDDGGTQQYHGVLFSAQRRFTRGVSLNANYTWSHCVGDPVGTGGGSTGNVGQGYLIPGYRRFDRGDCVFDRRHIANLSMVAETPRFENDWARRLGTGWRISGLYRFSSGAPLTVYTNADVQLSGTSNQRAVQLLLDPTASNEGDACPSVSRCISWFNLGAFGKPNAGELGNMSPFNVSGPSLWGLDMALSRSFRIIEGHTLEVRAEAFNITNSVHPGNPSTNVNVAATFGQIRTKAGGTPNALGGFTSGGPAGDARIMQFALKYFF